MGRVKRKLPMIETYVYNRVYEAVLESMQLIFLEDDKPSLLKGPPNGRAK